MIEYRIETKAKLSKVKAIWELFLQNDKTWHFTLEGFYIELRVSKYNLKIEKYLKEKKWKYTKFEYKDSIPITEKYQKQFEVIFHGFSELSMKLPKEKKDEKYSDIYRCYERVVHLYANIVGIGLIDECYRLARLTVERSHTAGKYSV